MAVGEDMNLRTLRVMSPVSTDCAVVGRFQPSTISCNEASIHSYHQEAS